MFYSLKSFFCKIFGIILQMKIRILELYRIGFELQSLLFIGGFIRQCKLEKTMLLNSRMIIYYTLPNRLEKDEYYLGQCLRTRFNTNK